MSTTSFATNWNADALEEQYSLWLQDPEQVDAQWCAFFEGFALGQQQKNGRAPAKSQARTAAPPPPPSGSADASRREILQARVIGAIYAFRSIGHTQAKLNPLEEEHPENPRLSLERLGFERADLDQVFHCGNYQGGDDLSVLELLSQLEQTYCGTIGVEYLHIQETPKRRWLQQRMEPDCNRPNFPRDQKIRVLRKVMEAETFERFLHTRYVGQKRFSLEGAETLIPLLDAIVDRCPELDIQEINMGMAHRGRLNVLANIVGKSYDFIFREFSENYMPESIHGDGDVKYHLGYEAERRTRSEALVEVRLASNPSHLEAVNPVVEGKARARQRIRGDLDRKKVVPILIHGDAAFTGQGIVSEVLNLAKLKGYRTGGTIHVIVNNQIGFTTDPTDARSSRYCTDIAKMSECPIFHVNGDDPLAVCMVAEMALEYRQQFADDVIIDMYCYRKHGHNEADEPGFTQPTLYKKIAAHPPISALLTKRLICEGDLSDADANKMAQQFQKTLNDAFTRVKNEEEKRDKLDLKSIFEGSNAIFQPDYNFQDVETGVARDVIKNVAKVLTTAPEGLKVNSKIQRQLKQKADAIKKGKGIDWGLGEALAFGTLLVEGTPVRLSGQDSERGTFSHRHAAWYDIENRERYVPLLNLSPTQAMFCVHNSSLSEAAVLGFDYGYSLDYPEMLAIWEAQFGDFANGAQVIIDQFLTSSESKWQRVSGLVMLLPHGYEGQGPEHSSARLERYLQACAENNIQVANVTTPAQLFHLLRRQVKRDFRKPLVIMSPKSLLRHKECVSDLADFEKGCFQSILDDPSPPQQAERVVLCSGKVYYDLVETRKNLKIKDAAIVRIEQYYPFNSELLQDILKKYKGYKNLVWCQEEPENMGAWRFLDRQLEAVSGKRVHYSGRDAAASPAVGSLVLHKAEQQQLTEQAFKGWR